MIIRNAIKCKICGDIIESFSVHDYKVCSCGACAVDGGHEYPRRSAKSFDDIIELSEVVKMICTLCVIWWSVWPVS